MRIGLVVPGFAADAADWCIPALTNLGGALAARPDVDLHIYALRYPPRAGRYRLRGATVHAFAGAPVAGRRVRGVSLGLLWTTFLATIRRDHAAAPFAVLHGFWATESGYLAAVAGRALGVPALVHLAGGELTADRVSGYGNRRPGLARLLVALSVRLATAITVPSSPLQAQLRRYYPQYAAKVASWAFGVDVNRFSPATGAGAGGASGEKLRLVQAASLLPVKNQALLLAGLAAARARAPEVRVTATLAGAGPLAGVLQAEIRRLDLAGRVTLAGDLPHDRLPDLYRAHDAFVLTSRHEAQCLAVLEAAACGLPWIGPPVGALADLARDPVPSGWLLEPPTAARLGESILTARDPAARAARGPAARAAVVTHYCLETQTDRLLALYRRAAHGSPPTGRYFRAG